MKRILFGGLLIAVSMLVSCAGGTVAPVVRPMEPIVVPIQPVEIEGLPSDALGVFQGSIKYGYPPPYRLRPGDTVDTWTELDETPTLGHKKGDPISIKIWNGYSSDVRVSIFWLPGEAYVNRLPGTDICEDSDGKYAIAPDYVKDWFTFKTGEYVIPSKTILDVPLYLYIPKDTTLKGKYIVQFFVVRVPDVPMGVVEGYFFKLKLDFE